MFTIFSPPTSSGHCCSRRHLTSTCDASTEGLLPTLSGKTYMIILCTSKNVVVIFVARSRSTRLLHVYASKINNREQKEKKNTACINKISQRCVQKARTAVYGACFFEFSWRAKKIKKSVTSRHYLPSVKNRTRFRPRNYLNRVY